MLRSIAVVALVAVVAIAGCGSDDPKPRSAASYLGAPPAGYSYEELPPARERAYSTGPFSRAKEVVVRLARRRSDGLGTAVVLIVRLENDRDRDTALADYLRAIHARKPDAITAGRRDAHLVAAERGVWLVYFTAPSTIVIASSAAPNEAERFAFELGNH